MKEEASQEGGRDGFSNTMRFNNIRRLPPPNIATQELNIDDIYRRRHAYMQIISHALFRWQYRERIISAADVIR